MAPRFPRRRTRRAGYTLVEIVIAVLLTSIMVTSVFSVALTAKQGGGKADRKLLAAQTARRMTNFLKNYVTGCDCNPTTGACSAASCTIDGPNVARGPNNVATWYLNAPPAVVDSRGDVWALASGEHRVTGTGVLPAWFLAPPYNGRVVYTVDNSVVVNGRPVSGITLDVQWDEP